MIIEGSPSLIFKSGSQEAEAHRRGSRGSSMCSWLEGSKVKEHLGVCTPLCQVGISTINPVNVFETCRPVLDGSSVPEEGKGKALKKMQDKGRREGLGQREKEVPLLTLLGEHMFPEAQGA